MLAGAWIAGSCEESGEDSSRLLLSVVWREFVAVVGVGDPGTGGIREEDCFSRTGGRGSVSGGGGSV